MTNYRAIQRRNKEVEAVKAKATAAAPAPATTVIANPNQEAATRRSTEHVAALRNAGRRTKTKKTLDPKREEYREYCRSEYSDDDAPYTVTKNKFWWFFLYQALRKNHQNLFLVTV